MMGEWFIQGVDYIRSKLWYDYAFWASILLKDKDYHGISILREEFLKDFYSVLFTSIIISLILTTLFSVIYKNKYNKKVSGLTLFKVAIFIGFLNLFKWELILLFPLFIISLCIAYLVIQEKEPIVRGIKKIIPYVIGFFSLYLFTYVAGKVFN